MKPAALVLVLLAAACGSTAKHEAAPKPALCPKAHRALVRLQRDIAAIRTAARTTREDSPQINAATDRFIADVSSAPIGNLKRNRLIDHAVGALLGQCESCFQALEAGRPIVSIHYGSSGCK